MSKVIFKLKFESPKKATTKKNNMYHLIYIATRDGVALNDDMKEFENNHNNSSNDEYVKYIADRPRSHGLFAKEKENIDLKELSNYMKNYDGYVYRGIVSLRESEAIGKGFDDKEQWETLVRSKMRFISKQLNIQPSNLGWVCAFHRESGHPHIHMMMWDKSYDNSKDLNKEYRKGAIPKKNIEAIRKELTKEIFSNEIENVLSLKNVYRDFLTETTKGFNNSDYSKKFLELDEKIDEINTKYDVKKYEERLTILKKEISEHDNIDYINDKYIEIEELKTKIDEMNKKISMYDIRDNIKGLENEKEIIKLERELKIARSLGNVDKYEDYIYQAKFNLGIFQLQKNRKICSNKKEVIKMKCDLVDLINKKKCIDIENDFNDKNIKIDTIDIEKLSNEEVELREQYLKLKAETEHIEIKDIDNLEEKIFELSSEFEANKWKLDEDIEENLFVIKNGIEYLNKDYFNEINTDLDTRIKNLTDRITEQKMKPFAEIEFLKKSDFNDIESTNLFELEKELNNIKNQYDINKKEGALKKLKSTSKNKIKNDKITELEDKLKELELDLKNSSFDNIEYIKNEILQVKNEIDEEKEIQISKDLINLQNQLDLVKDELGVIDIEVNDFILGDRVRGKTLEEIGEMIVELQVPKEGRLQYKLMPPEVKAEINKITDRIIELPQYKKMFDGYMKSVEELTRLYTDKAESIEEAKENAKDDIYKRIGNNILKTKKEIVVDKKKPDFAVQKLFNNIAKLFSINTNRNEKTKLISKENSRAERKKQAQENKARGLYSEQELE